MLELGVELMSLQNLRTLVIRNIIFSTTCDVLYDLDLEKLHDLEVTFTKNCPASILKNCMNLKLMKVGMNDNFLAMDIIERQTSLESLVCIDLDIMDSIRFNEASSTSLFALKKLTLFGLNLSECQLDSTMRILKTLKPMKTLTINFLQEFVGLQENSNPELLMAAIDKRLSVVENQDKWYSLRVKDRDSLRSIFFSDNRDRVSSIDGSPIERLLEELEQSFPKAKIELSY